MLRYKEEPSAFSFTDVTVIYFMIRTFLATSFSTVGELVVTIKCGG